MRTCRTIANPCQQYFIQEDDTNRMDLGIAFRQISFNQIANRN